MKQEDWLELVGATFTMPRQAAEKIIAFHLPRDVLYTALALVALVNTILFVLAGLMMPAPNAPPLYSNPIALYVIMLGCFILMVHGLFWTGRAFGGQGEMGDVLVLLTWLQAVQAGVQLGQLVLLLVMPGIASVLALVVSLWLVWVTVQFLAAAFRFENAWRAAGVLFAAATAVAIGLSFLAALIGVSAVGVPANV